MVLVLGVGVGIVEERGAGGGIGIGEEGILVIRRVMLWIRRVFFG